MSNSGNFTELQTTSFIESTGSPVLIPLAITGYKDLIIPVLLLACSQDWTSNLQTIVSLEASGINAYNVYAMCPAGHLASNNTGILNTCTRLWLMESERAIAVDSIKDIVWSSVKIPEFDKHLKKAGRHIGLNVVEITIKMKTIVWKPLMIKITKLRLSSSIWSIDRTISGTITPGQGGTGSNGTPHSAKLQNWSRTIRLFSVISRTLVRGSYTSVFYITSTEWAKSFGHWRGFTGHQWQIIFFKSKVVL